MSIIRRMMGDPEDLENFCFRQMLIFVALTAAMDYFDLTRPWSFMPLIIVGYTSGFADGYLRAHEECGKPTPGQKKAQDAHHSLLKKRIDDNKPS